MALHLLLDYLLSGFVGVAVTGIIVAAVCWPRESKTKIWKASR